MKANNVAKLPSPLLCLYLSYKNILVVFDVAAIDAAFRPLVDAVGVIITTTSSSIGFKILIILPPVVPGNQVHQRNSRPVYRCRGCCQKRRCCGCSCSRRGCGGCSCCCGFFSEIFDNMPSTVIWNSIGNRLMKRPQ